MDLFVEIVNSFQPLTILVKNAIFDVFQGSEYVSVSSGMDIIKYEIMTINLYKFKKKHH